MVAPPLEIYLCLLGRSVSQAYWAGQCHRLTGQVSVTGLLGRSGSQAYWAGQGHRLMGLEGGFVLVGGGALEAMTPQGTS